MERIFLTVLNMSLTASFVIAAIVLARLPLKKAPKIISYCLWAVAFFRLVFPFSIESSLSLIPFNAETIPPALVSEQINSINSGIVNIDTPVNNFIGQMHEESRGDAYGNAWRVYPLKSFVNFFSYMWLAGGAALVIYGVVSFIILKRKMRDATHSEANIYEAENIKSPFVLGVINPKIYLPIGLSEQEKSYIVLHERTHIGRRDHAVKLLAYLVLCLHWFNPFAWTAFVLMGSDMEMSCDERVMRELGADIKNAYSLSLVRVAAGRKIINGSPLAFGEGGMKERVKNVLKFKKPSRIVIIAAAALAVVLTVGFAVSRTATPDLPPEDIVQSGEPDNSAAPDSVDPSTEYGSPSIILYEYDTSVADGDGDVVKHLIRELKPEEDSGWTTLADTIFIQVLVPDGTVEVRTYYAESGTGATEYIMMDSTYSDPYRSQPEGSQSPTGNTWRALDYFSAGFLGHIWAVTVDANGAERYSEIVNVSSPFDADGNALPRIWGRRGEGRYMTLDDVRELSRKFGENLSAEDIAGFPSSYTSGDWGREWRYFIDEKWYLEVMVNPTDGGESMVTWLVPYGYEFRPQGSIDIRREDVDEYIAYVEAYDGSQTQLSESELAAAHAAALGYYKTTSFDVSEVTHIEDATEYAWAVIVSRVKGKLVGFYTAEKKLEVQRLIVLTQTDDGGWEVINEGY